MKEGAHARDTLASDGSRTLPGAPVEPAEFTTLFLAHGLPARRPHCASPQKTVSPGRWSRSRRARPPVKLWPAMDLGPTNVVPGACESSDFSSRARPPRAPRSSAHRSPGRGLVPGRLFLSKLDFRVSNCLWSLSCRFQNFFSSTQSRTALEVGWVRTKLR